MAYTQLSPTGTPSKQYLFTPKTEAGTFPRVYGLFTELSVVALPGKRHSFSAKTAGWTNAVLTGINLETGDLHHIVGYTYGARAKGFDTISGRYINEAIKIGEHLIILD